MTQVLFNQTPPRIGNSIEEPSQDVIETTLNLRQVSLEDAVRYGGPITRAAIGAMEFVGDRKYIIVDTKVHLLMPSFIPAIPGWHTDGVPRGEEMNPAGRGKPNLRAQVEGLVTAPRYHLLTTGDFCPTTFMTEPTEFDLDLDLNSDLYKNMSQQVNKLDSFKTLEAPASTVVDWDWFNVHAAIPSRGRGWRYLIRVAETDHIPPRTDPSDFIRTQNQVYVSTEFGW